MDIHQKTGLAIADIETITEIPKKSLYRHLDYLFKGGFVTKDKDSRTSIYLISEVGQQRLTNYSEELNSESEDETYNPFAIIDA